MAAYETGIAPARQADRTPKTEELLRKTTLRRVLDFLGVVSWDEVLREESSTVGR
jgi:hypothetical protein